ncbi:putative leucine-tRNA ligase, cytoplasmic [Smittium mucronatum]|uniref:leucine--tRNA ligase n=1 Tax=Smittium mucronatum TaxID=133383 RepID=A0A1R0H686_9FUNG|nr:putative leucine-tRNA ligase, cytoplasmic [Smittium mucronatum]
MAEVVAEQKTSKRDALRKIESTYQKLWKDNKAFEKNSPAVASELEADWKNANKENQKYMATFPYPYMNGKLHLGHSFSFSKAEFSVRWNQLKGKNALFPFGFHATGMPIKFVFTLIPPFSVLIIKASADKIAREIELFGPDFSGFSEADEIESDLKSLSVNKSAKSAPKPARNPYQFEIMLSLGIDRNEIKKFAEPKYWLDTFIPMAINDVTTMGCCVDWRRSFTTTDINPYYDSFARWQFLRFKEMGNIKFGKRYTIWSIKDGQPCMDHDRYSGEGIGPQEYTAIKLKVLDFSPQANEIVSQYQTSSSIQSSSTFYLVAATLRPETMYGQTNCFVGVNIDYGFFDIGNGNIYITTERAAKNMAYQGNSLIPDQVTCLGNIKGSDLIGSKVSAPLSSYDHVYVLPMENVLANKGTGVVTSVPSDSPVDFISLRDLKRKPEYYKIDPSWVENYNPVDVIETNLYGTQTAPFLCESLKIQSQKDISQLDEAKELSYKEGFYNGKMAAGKYKGMSVQDAKPLIRADLIASGDGFAYAEPEGLVISRSGDECIVALCDQWYFNYGESEWRKLVESYLETMNTGSAEARNQFKATLAWLGQWACARSFGLGSKVPWDESILIESLSDSTIYMSYYTVSHLLHPKSVDGSDVGPLKLTHEDMNYEAWDYVFLGKTLPDSYPKKKELAELRKSFLYWYPMDLRTSGKDLIQNHLSFCLYNHAAMFPAELQPRAMHVNGHLLLNGNKMSKSSGNFMTLGDSLQKYGADATRIALADAGDGLEDANFEVATANASILRLYLVIEWAMGVFGVNDGLEFAKTESVEMRQEDSPLDLFDRVFLSMIDKLTIETYNAYESSTYRLALKSSFYEMLSARDWYREVTTVSGLCMHKGVIRSFVTSLARLTCPIVPHWAEHLYTHVLKNKGSVFDEKISIDSLITPQKAMEIEKDLAIGDYIKKLVKSIREAEVLLMKQSKAKKLKTLAQFDPKQPKKLEIVVSKTFPKWQTDIVDVLKANFVNGEFNDAEIRANLGKMGILKDKKTMPFANEIKKNVAKFGADEAFDRKLLFDEREILSELVITYIKASCGYVSVDVIELEENAENTKNSSPGSPSFSISNI